MWSTLDMFLPAVAIHNPTMFPTDPSKTLDVTIEWDKNERQRARNRINQRNYRRRKSEQARENDKNRTKSTSRSPRTPSRSASELPYEDSEQSSQHGESSTPMMPFDMLSAPWQVSAPSRASSLDPLMFTSEHINGDRSISRAWIAPGTAQVGSPGHMTEHVLDSTEWPGSGVLESSLDLSALSSRLTDQPWSTSPGPTLRSNRSDLSSNTSSRGKTTLHLAAENGHTQSIQILLSYGADPDVRDQDGYTALHIAAAANHPDIIACLIEAGCDMNVMTFAGRTALHLAAENNNSEIIDQLLRAGGDPNIQISEH